MPGSRVVGGGEGQDWPWSLLTPEHLLSRRPGWRALGQHLGEDVPRQWGQPPAGRGPRSLPLAVELPQETLSEGQRLDSHVQRCACWRGTPRPLPVPFQPG